MTATEQRFALVVSAWRLLLSLLGVGHVAVGAAWLVNGPGWLVDNPTFEQVAEVPWWLWGAWAIVSGALILTARTRVVGLAVTAGWYATWTALLVPALFRGGPYYAIGVYLTVTAVHVLIALVEITDRRLQAGEPRV